MVKNGFSCVVFPFQFDAAQLRDEAFNAPIQKRNGKSGCIWEPDKLKGYHMKENISSMLGLGAKSGTIGQIYALSDGMRRELNIPDARTALELSCRGRKEPIPCKLPHVRMALFDTGIGFLELTFSDLPDNVEDVVDLNYFLCEIKSGDNVLHYKRRLGKDEEEDRSLTLLEMLQKLTASLGDVNDFDTIPGLRYIDNKPLIFSYVLQDTMPENFGKVMFNLRTNFKASYQMPHEEYDLVHASNTLHPFENVWWGTSLNATVCCAFLTDHATTNEFFETTFPSNLRQTYLQLFLLRQHQRYCMQRLQKLYADAGNNLLGTRSDNTLEAYEHINALRENAIAFKLRCMFSDPTTVEHINCYDDYLCDNLHIPQTMKSFEDSIEQLSHAAAVLKEQLDRQEQVGRDAVAFRRERMIFMFTSLWTTVICLSSAWDISERLVRRDIWFDTPWIILPIALTLLPVGITIYNFIKSKEIELIT